MAIPTEAIPASHAPQFEALRRKFVDGLTLRLQEIEGAPDATSLHAALHRLAGVAGAYGYDGLGQLARTVMHTSRHSTENLRAPLVELTTAMRDLIAMH